MKALLARRLEGSRFTTRQLYQLANRRLPRTSPDDISTHRPPPLRAFAFIRGLEND